MSQSVNNNSEMNGQIAGIQSQLNNLSSSNLDSNSPEFADQQTNLLNNLNQLIRQKSQMTQGDSFVPNGSSQNADKNISSKDSKNLPQADLSFLAPLKAKLQSLISLLMTGSASPEHMAGKYASAFEGAGQLAADALGVASNNPSILGPALSFAAQATEVAGEFKTQIGASIAGLKDNQKKSRDNVRQSDPA